MIVQSLPPGLRGLYVQPYRAKIEGNTHAARMANLRAAMVKWKSLGCVGFAPHGFTQELPQALPELVDMGRSVGLRVIPAFGMDSDDAVGKGDRLLGAAGIPGVDGIMCDLEGKLEDEPRPVEEEHARLIGGPMIASSHPIVVLHQPWPIPQYHEARFPWTTFATYCTAWCNQDYFGAWKNTYGIERYSKLSPLFSKWWNNFNARVLVQSGHGNIARQSTVEGYNWSDIPYDAVKCVLRYETQFVWSEWKPEAEMLHAFQARKLLSEKVGLYVDGKWSGRDVVFRFQQAYNAKASTRLVADGVYGPKTDAALFENALMRAMRYLKLTA